MEYMYGTQGAYTQDDKMPVFKELKQTGIVLAAADGSITINATGTEAEMTVPMTRPHVDRRNAVQQGFHTADITVRFSKNSIETLLDPNGDYGDKIYLELYKRVDGNFELQDNTANRYFDIQHNGEVGYSNLVESDKKTAYLQPQKAGTEVTEADQTFKIAVRNMEPGETYQLRMYCKKGAEKVYVIDNSDSVTIKGEIYGQNMAMASYLNVGKTDSPDSKAFTAAYTQDNYESQNLDVTYSLNRILDYRLEYKVLTEENNQQVANMTPADMMRYLGYPNEEETEYWYYNEKSSSADKWTVYKYKQYFRMNTDGDKEYFQIRNNIGEDNPERFTFTGTYMDVLPEGRYKLQIQALDLSGGSQLEHRQEGMTVTDSLGTPAVSFSVPARKAPETTLIKGSIQNTGQGMKLPISISVQDNGYRMGIIENGNKIMGNYRVKIYKYQSGSWRELVIGTDTDAPIGLDDGSHYEKDKYYTIYLHVGSNDSFRVQISGIDTKSVDPGKEIILYETDFTVGDTTRPQMNNMDQSYDSSKKLFTISVQNGNNLDMINRISLTLTNVSHMPPTAANESFDMTFSAADGNGWQEMTFDLGRAIDELEGKGLRVGELLSLTVQYQNGEQYLTQSTYSFRYR